MTGEMPNWGTGSGGNGYEALGYLILLAIDIAFLPVALVVCFVRLGIEAERDNRGDKWDGIDTFSATVTSLPEAKVNTLVHKFDSLPESEIDALADKFYSLPEQEIDAYSQTLNSFSEKEITVMFFIINSLPEEKIISLVQTLNSMPEEKFVSVMKNLKSIDFQHLNRRIGK
jgi:hypothetical protein